MNITIDHIKRVKFVDLSDESVLVDIVYEGKIIPDISISINLYNFIAGGYNVWCDIIGGWLEKKE